MKECADTNRQVTDRSNADGGNNRADVVERGDSYSANQRRAASPVLEMHYALLAIFFIRFQMPRI